VGQKTDIELARLALAKVTRTEVRLRHALAADAELNSLLADRLARFDAAIQRGEVPALVLALIEAGDEAR
jgi:hypothetical protein